MHFNFGICGTEEGGKRYTNYLIRKEKGRYNLVKRWGHWKENMKMDIKEKRRVGVDWIWGVGGGFFEDYYEASGFVKGDY